MKKKNLLIAIVLILLFILLMLIFSLNFVYNSNIKKEIKVDSLKSNINEEVYIALYVGDIDGEVSDDWLFFYDKITDFYEKNKIPVVFSFYPATIKNDEIFNKKFLRMYQIPNIELMQKGYRGDELERNMDHLSFEQQREIIKKGRDHFKEKIKEMTNSKNIIMPILYNQIGSRFTEETKRAAESLGFKFYFDVYIGEGLKPINSSKTFAVTQYGVSFTKTGNAGKEEKFKTPQEIFNEINTFSREDLQVLKINGKKFIPIWVHQQDFESSTQENKLDKNKWQIYTQVVEALNNDPNVHLILPSQAYKIRD